MSIFEFRQSIIKTHVFVISPNNSGSTLMKNLLALSQHVWSLEREGQFSFGFQGPVSGKPMKAISGGKTQQILMDPLTWAATAASIDYIRDPRRYDWEKNRKSWYMTARSIVPKRASIFLEKTPSHLLIVDQLMEAFEDCRFIFMARNPYAAIEGIKRRENIRQYMNDPEVNLVKHGALHIRNCLRIQKKNIEAFSQNGRFISYETLCDAPQHAAQSLASLIPELNDLDLSADVQVKQYELQKTQNMNTLHISALTQEEKDIISEIFHTETELLSFFGYELL